MGFYPRGWRGRSWRLRPDKAKIPHRGGGSIAGKLKQATVKRAPATGNPRHLVPPLYSKQLVIALYFIYHQFYLATLALITTQADVTFFSNLELRPPLVTDNLPDQIEAHVVSRQCAEVSGRRALPFRNDMGLIKAASGGGSGCLLLFFLTYSVFCVSIC